MSRASDTFRRQLHLAKVLIMGKMVEVLKGRHTGMIGRVTDIVVVSKPSAEFEAAIEAELTSGEKIALRMGEFKHRPDLGYKFKGVKV